MKNIDLICKDEQRRRLVREKKLNGLDYLEVSDDQLTITVYSLGKAPQDIQKENVIIKGGQRITGIKVVGINICRVEDEERDDCMMVHVDKFGDFSTYTLCLVEIDEQKQPIIDIDEQGRKNYRPLHGFDPRYACLEFTFKAGCPSDLDCKARPVCPPRRLEEPEINYLAKDYASFRQLILDRLALIMPDWRERHVPDLGITLVELLAYVGDHLSYYQDSVATEAYLDTARQRISVRRHARLVDYVLHEGCNARAWVTLQVSQNMTGEYALIPKDFYLITDPGTTTIGKIHDPTELPKTLPRPYLIFEPLLEDRESKIELYEAHNEMKIYTWGNEKCCIPKGATSATLWDSKEPRTDPDKPEEEINKSKGEPMIGKPDQSEQKAVKLLQKPGYNLKLNKCDIVIFEEVKGPKTGNPADADPRHRHAVRLTKAIPSKDPLTGTLIWEIEWAEEDALLFPVCVSSIKEDDCSLIPDVTVVRGNVILVDHGERVEDDLEQVPTKTILPECGDECSPRDPISVPGWYRPNLLRTELTFSEPLRKCKMDSKCSNGPKFTPATVLLKQDVRRVLPCAILHGVPSASNDSTAPAQEIWNPQQDLLASGPDDRHFVVEIDNDQRPHLRFGDGELGRMPDAGMTFQAVYRVGNGPSGNVGAETITHIVFRNKHPHGIDIRPRNPFPAVGGTTPEPMTEAKLFAPHAFRKELQRAITADDYAHIVMRDFKHKVQWAAAKLRWTGSWYEVMVAVDPLGSEEADEELLCEITRHLYRFRRIGHDVVVRLANYVPLYIAMTVCVLPHYLRGHVKAELLNVFSNRQLPDGRKGFFHPDNLTFGEGIYLSKLIEAAQAVTGVESVVITTLERLFEASNKKIDNGILPLGSFEVARLDNDPSYPENGKLTLDMGGGR